MVAEQPRRPLVGFAAHEAVEIVEAHARGPLIERTRGRIGVSGGVVVLAEPRGGVAVILQDVADRGVVRTDDRIVARKAGGLLGDHPEARRMVVAPGDQRGARRRAERRGMELGVAQPVGRDLVERRRRDDAAEGAGDAVARVVGDDQQDVRRALRRDHGRRPPGRRLLGVEVDDPAERPAARPAATGRRSSTWRWASRACRSPAAGRRRERMKRSRWRARRGKSRVFIIQCPPFEPPRTAASALQPAQVRELWQQDTPSCLC